MCDGVCVQLCPLSADTPASGQLPRLEAGTSQMLAPYREQVRPQVTLPGAGDSLTGLGCLYTVNAASGLPLGSPQEMAWFPTEFKVRSVFMFAGLLWNVD